MGGRRGHPFVVSAPSGTGKTTVCREVIARDPEISFSVSHTTRPARPGEREGIDYHFVSEAAFRRLIEAQAFVEYAEYAGRMYGTSWQALEQPLARGQDLLLEIEIEGARQVRERLAEARLVFLLPPSLEALEGRLRERGTDPPAAVRRRLTAAAQELRAAEWFDYLVMNDEFESAVSGVLAIVRAVRGAREESLSEPFGRDAVLAHLDPVLSERIRG